MSIVNKFKTIVLLLLIATIFLGCPFIISSSFALSEREKNNIDIYTKHSPGVVYITSVVLEFDFFLNPTPKAGTGSGSIVDHQGHIITNYHVVKDAKRLEVTLIDGSKWRARLVGIDPDYDLAVLQINAPENLLHVIPCGDSDNLKVGQRVLAIGNPFGLERTLTTGIISSLGRSIRSRNSIVIDDVIQTDASINPGNSGGPLFDSEGNMIGINTAIISPTGANIGIGFAIPINVVKRAIPDLIAVGYVDYPWVGATVYTLLPEYTKRLNIGVDRGAIIINVISDGPADTAGLLGGTRQAQVGNTILHIGGDIILGVDEIDIKTADELVRYIKKKRPGQGIKLKVFRHGQVKSVGLILGKKPRKP